MYTITQVNNMQEFYMAGASSKYMCELMGPYGYVIMMTDTTGRSVIAVPAVFSSITEALDVLERFK